MLDSFLQRFDAICREHVASGRAKAFAFIFYDFTSWELRKVLKDQGVFAQLDRLAGTTLSIFYLHTGRKEAINKFNSVVLEKLGVAEQAVPPCVVFFRLKKDKIQDVAVAQLDSGDLVHGFHELHSVVERYIEADLDGAGAGAGVRYLRWLKSSRQFIALELFRASLKKGLDFLF
jgi:hypothetical protein